MSSQSPQSPIPTMCLKQDCLILFLELIWPEVGLTLLTIVRLLEMTQLVAVQKSDLPGKRQLKNFLQTFQKGMKILKTQDKELSKSIISFEQFKDLFEEQELYTILCQESLLQTVSTYLKDVWEKHFLEEFSSGHFTSTTSMSCMTAATLPINADALEYSASPLKDDLGSFINSISTVKDTSSISQSIYVNRQESLLNMKLEDEHGQYLFKLEMYNTKDIAQLDKSQWWRTALMKMSFLTMSKVDPVHILLEKVMHQVVKRIAENENVKKEVKKKSYLTGLNNFRQAPY